MPRDRIKPPAETKGTLMIQVSQDLQRKYPLRPDAAVEYLLNYFTSADLVGIRDELRRK